LIIREIRRFSGLGSIVKTQMPLKMLRQGKIFFNKYLKQAKNISVDGQEIK